MLRSGVLAAPWVVSLAIALVVPAHAQDVPPSSSVSEIALPGGLRAAMEAVGDNTTPDRARFLAEFIHRIYDTPLGAHGDVRQPVLQSLVAGLNGGGSMEDTIPLPLSIPFWLDVVFRGKTTRPALLTSILQSRGAALFYYGLLSLDDDTRTWLAGHPSLVSDIVSRRPGAFVVAAPGLRVASGRMRMPGGAPADPVWHALLGRRDSEPADLTKALLSANEGRLAYFFGAMAQLTPSQLRFALNLDNGDVSARVAAGRRLYSAFEHMWNGRALESRVFTRPPYDPALLASELDTAGHSSVPGTRGFWVAAFADQEETAPGSKATTAAPLRGDEPPDFSWLCDQVFKGDASSFRRRYMMVLFASRHAEGITANTAADALEAVRATATYPALAAALERARVTDLSIFAAAARRAAALNTIDDAARASRALAQFQGGVAMITRSVARGSLTSDSASALIASLAAIPVNQRGEYEGRIVSWLAAWLKAGASSAQGSSPVTAGDDTYDSVGGPIEDDALRVLAGSSSAAKDVVDWEGTRYRVDLPHAEAIKLTLAHGTGARPYLSAASEALTIAEALADPSLTRDGLRQHTESLARLRRGETDEPENDPSMRVEGSFRDVLSSLQRASRSNDLKAAARVAPALRLLADDLAARGLMEWTYAAALGPRDGLTISAADAASRHDFGFHASPTWRAHAWELPSTGTDSTQLWRVTGSLLGIDVALANFSLVALSSKPPAHRPTLDDSDRRAFIESIALMEPRLMTDPDRDAIAEAIRKGRSRLGAVRSPADTFAIADLLRMSPLSRTLFAWTAAHDGPRTGRYLSYVELFWLGTSGQVPAGLHAWGVPAQSRIGCLCLQVIGARPWETFAGRWNTGMTASAFPDLNLHLAELLSEMHMPAPLLAPVLNAAVLDFIMNVLSRDPDDRRAMTEFVQSLGTDRVELYLALLTTDGPLVPLGDSPPGKLAQRWMSFTQRPRGTP